MKVLIVDDNETNRYLTKSLLNHFGFDIIECSNGLEALNELRKQSIDLIISDILMPIMDGFALCREVRKNPQFCHIPFIVYTATYTGPQDEILAMKMGANRYIIRPCEPETFIKHVHEVITKIQKNEIVPTLPEGTEEDILKLYNERLVRKLEQKMLQTEEEIKARMKLIEELHRSEALLEATQSISKIGGWEWDLEKNELYWTAETYKIHDMDITKTGMSSEIIEKSIACYSSENRQRIREAIFNCVKHGVPYFLESSFTTTKGRELYIYTSGEPVYSGDKIVKVRGIIQDITEQKKMEKERTILKEKLLQNQKLESIGQLAGGIAHDYNNILAVILGYCEEILLKTKPNDKYYKELTEIYKAGKRAARLTQQLLTFSKKQIIQPQVLSINDTIEDLADMLNRLIREDIVFQIKLGEDIECVKIDAIQLEQVILNLIINACEAMPIGGKLLLETSKTIINNENIEHYVDMKEGEYVLLTVKDTGCGMSKDIIDRIYEPFFTTKTDSKGTGLGLSTVYGIVKQANGYIVVTSEPGKGAEFNVFFPVAKEKPKPIEKDFSLQDFRGNGENLVLIEDDFALMTLTGKTLKALGYEVSMYENPVDALVSIVKNKTKPDLIITDVVLPVLNGKELIDILKEVIPDLKVLFISGYTNSIIEHHGVLDLEIPFLQKPFTKEKLASVIFKILHPLTIDEQVCFKILMIDDDESLIALYERAFSQKGSYLTGTDNFKHAMDLLAKDSYDVVLVDLNIPGTDGVSIVKAIRKAGYELPIFVLSGDIGNIDWSVLNPLGVKTAFEKSSDISSIIEHLINLQPKT